MSYKNWKLINESMGFPLGLVNPQNLGAVGSNYEEGSYMSRRSYMPPMVDEDDEDLEEDEFEDEDDEYDDEFGPEDELEDDEFGDEFDAEDSFPPKAAGAEMLGDETDMEDEFGDEMDLGDEMGGEFGDEMDDISDDEDYDPSEILSIDPSVIDGMEDDEMGMEDDEMGMEDDEMGMEDDEMGMEDEDLEDGDMEDEDDEMDMDDEDLEDGDMEEYMGDMKRAHMGYMKRMMQKKLMHHESTIAEIQNEQPLNENPLAIMNMMQKPSNMPKMGGKSKKNKKRSKHMTKEHTETYKEFLGSLTRGARNEQSKTHSSGLSEDALYAVEDPNMGFNELPSEPQAGEVGFAPQGTVGGAMGAGGYTQDDMAQLPTVGEVTEPETEEELDEWMDIAFGYGALVESDQAINEGGMAGKALKTIGGGAIGSLAGPIGTAVGAGIGASMMKKGGKGSKSKKRMRKENYMHDDDGGCEPGCKCKKCKKMRMMKKQESQQSQQLRVEMHDHDPSDDHCKCKKCMSDKSYMGGKGKSYMHKGKGKGKGKKHMVKESTDFLSSLVNSAKRTRGGW